MIKDVFIVHYKPLKERRVYLEKALKGLNVTFVDQYERNTVDPGLVQQWYKKNAALWDMRAKSVYKHAPMYRELSGAEICNFLSHVKILDEIIERELSVAIVLEDDVIIKDSFYSSFDSYFAETPSDFDIVFFGSAFTIAQLEKEAITLTAPMIVAPGKVVYEKVDHPKTRTVDAYILTFAAAKKLRAIIQEMTMPYDFDLAYFIKEASLKVYWWEPGLVTQGSQTGEYTSAIRNSGMKAKLKNILKKVLFLRK